jgi:hypothetical protein
MVRHIVFWRLKGDSHEQKDTAAREIKRRLESLNGRIPGLRLIEVGIDFSHSPESADLALYSEFDSREALAGYLEHPEHKAVMPFIQEARSERRVADYESEND